MVEREQQNLVFGPVVSRRLGNSLGIKNVPAKRCTYACVYCQAGATRHMSIVRQKSYGLNSLVASVEHMVEEASKKGVRIDYLSIVPDGEPTLDLLLEDLIKALGKFAIPIAVITNGSLLSLPSVQRALLAADWISIKVDSVTEKTWRKVNRPHGRLALERIREGILSFSKTYEGLLVTETMLAHNYNDNEEEMGAVGDFLSKIDPTTAYLSIPTRPPVLPSVKPPREVRLHQSYLSLKSQIPKIPLELLASFDETEFPCLGDTLSNIVAMTTVHPLRQETLHRILQESDLDFSSIENLVDEGRLAKRKYGGTVYYVNVED